MHKPSHGARLVRHHKTRASRNPRTPGTRYSVDLDLVFKVPGVKHDANRADIFKAVFQWMDAEANGAIQIKDTDALVKKHADNWDLTGYWPAHRYGTKRTNAPTTVWLTYLVFSLKRPLRTRAIAVYLVSKWLGNLEIMPGDVTRFAEHLVDLGVLKGFRVTDSEPYDERASASRTTKKKGPPYYAPDGTRLTDCCGTRSTYSEDALCCKKCWEEVPSGQGDGSEMRPPRAT